MNQTITTPHKSSRRALPSKPPSSARPDALDKILDQMFQDTSWLGGLLPTQQPTTKSAS
jgi:hypothetical protein